MLTSCFYFSSRETAATSLIPMRWQVSDRHHRLGPPSRNSNAYAIRRKYEKKIECMEKSFQISYLRFGGEEIASLSGANCVMRVTVEQSRLRR